MTVLVIADHRRGNLRSVSYELVTAGRELADPIKEELHVAVISGDVGSFAEKLNLQGVDRIHAVDQGEEFNHDIHVQAVEALDAEIRPDVLLMPHSANGLDYAPAVADSLDLPLVTDVIDLTRDGGLTATSLTATREMYGSKVETTVEVDAPRVAVTVRGGEWPPTEMIGTVDVERLDVEIDEARVRSRVKGFEEVAAGEIDLTDADVIVSVGRGIGDEKGFELVERLADALGATLAASRPIVDSGWLPKSRLVGQSGAVVAPDVYIAVGISGAVQHVAGMKGADTIIAINADPNAPIFDIADYGVVADLFDVVPALVEEFQ